jgi:ferredoxin
MKRNLIEIDQEKCNGCGLCVNACHEGAIELVDGKARVVSETYCDGLGACLPHCPTGAITIVEKEAAAYDEQAAMKHLAQTANPKATAESAPQCGCPGSTARTLQQSAVPTAACPAGADSELRQWPVQIKLVNVQAPYFQNADLLVAADCTAYAYAAFHQDFIRGRITLVGCPKLDDNEFYTQKLAEILSCNDIRSICVVRMEVPCCSGITHAVKKAMLTSGVIVPYSEVVISVDGSRLQ